MTPTNFFGVTNIKQIGMLAKTKVGGSGTSENKTADFLFDVGLFELNLTSPQKSEIVVSYQSGGLMATNSSITATFTLKKTNGIVVKTSSGTSFSHYAIGLTEAYRFLN